MNHCVRNFGMDDDYSIPASSGLPRPKKSPLAEEEIMELLWENGQVVMQSQNQRSLRKSQIGDAVPAEQSAAREIRPHEESATELFMQEDEMASWLHYPIDDSSFDRDLYTELIYPAACGPLAPPARIPEVRESDVKIPTPSAPVTAAPRPPIPPPRRAEAGSSAWFQNCVHSTKRSTEPGPSSSNKTARESTVVDSSVTPAAAAPESRASHFAGSSAQVSGSNIRWDTMSGGTAAAVTSSAGGGSREAGTCEQTVTSSPGGSGASVSASAEPAHKQQKQLPPPTEDRKRKGREGHDTDCQSEDVAFLSTQSKRQARGSTKRSRATEVHNLSERRRRDRINEKMRALQELIPRCNKSDKASMLDEAIEYLKSLQLQVQMMSMGCNMVPMMFPGVQQYMPPMGMGMGMGMGMSRPMMPFPSVLAGSAVSTQATTAHLGPRFPMPAFPLHPVPVPDASKIQATAQSDAMLNSLGTQNPNQPRMPNFADAYQQYLGLYHTQVPLPPNQAMMQPGSSREVQTHQHLQSG